MWYCLDFHDKIGNYVAHNVWMPATRQGRIIEFTSLQGQGRVQGYYSRDKCDLCHPLECLGLRPRYVDQRRSGMYFISQGQYGGYTALSTCFAKKDANGVEDSFASSYFDIATAFRRLIGDPYDVQTTKSPDAEGNVITTYICQNEPLLVPWFRAGEVSASYYKQKFWCKYRAHPTYRMIIQCVNDWKCRETKKDRDGGYQLPYFDGKQQFPSIFAGWLNGVLLGCQKPGQRNCESGMNDPDMVAVYRALSFALYFSGANPSNGAEKLADPSFTQFVKDFLEDSTSNPLGTVDANGNATALSQDGGKITEANLPIERKKFCIEQYYPVGFNGAKCVGAWDTASVQQVILDAQSQNPPVVCTQSDVWVMTATQRQDCVNSNQMMQVETENYTEGNKKMPNPSQRISYPMVYYGQY